MGLVGRKKITMSGSGERTARRRVPKVSTTESMRPLRLRGRREFVTAMVDALNDILATERAPA